MLSVSTTLNNTNCIVKCRYATCRSHFTEDRGLFRCKDRFTIFMAIDITLTPIFFFTPFTAVN